MKKLVALVLAAIMLLSVMSGCSGKNSSDGEKKDDLIVAISSEPKSLDAHGSCDSSSSQVHTLIYDTLLRQEDGGAVTPGLADSWEWVDDLTLDLHIREGVKFHNGQALNANDVVYSLRRAQDSEFTNWIVATMDADNTTALDDRNVEIKLTEPTGAMLAQLCYLFVVDEETIEGGADMEEQPNGTGPFIFDKWTQGDRLDFKSNKEYWGTVPAFSTLTLRLITEPSSRGMEIESGGVDIALNIAANDIENLEANKDVNLIKTPSYSNVFIGFNCSAEPFNNKTLRQAVSYALDRQAIVDVVYRGSGSLANGPIAPTIWGYNEDLVGYPHDVEKAKQLMAEAGYPDGLEITITVSDSQERVDIAEMVQNQLKEIGITVKVESLENATYLDRIIDASTQMYILGWITNTGDADYGMYEPFHTGQPTWSNTACYSNPAVDEQLEIGKRSTDSEVRMEAYRIAQELIVDDAPWVFLCNKQEVAACRSNVQGFTVPPSARFEYNTVTFN